MCFKKILVCLYLKEIMRIHLCGFVFICVDLYSFVWICIHLCGFVFICRPTESKLKSGMVRQPTSKGSKIFIYNNFLEKQF